MNRLFIVTSDIQTGKTTRLTEWCKGRNNVDGILSPVIDGKRYLKHIKSENIKLLEANDDTPNKNRVKVGKFIFDQSAFEWGEKKLEDAFRNKPDWLVIDEIGPLELNGKGFEKAVKKILSRYSANQINVIVVVRKSIIENFIDHYNLDKNKINIFNFDV